MNTKKEEIVLQSEAKKRQKLMAEAAARAAEIAADFIVITQHGYMNCEDARRVLEMAGILLDINLEIEKD